MAGKVGHLKIFGYNFTFVLRHRYEKKDENDIFDTLMEWREWELGFWFRRFQVVGIRNFHKPKEWSNNLVHEYMFGINFLWGKAWFTVQRGAMVLEGNNQSSRGSTGLISKKNRDPELNEDTYDYIVHKEERDRAMKDDFEKWKEDIEKDLTENEQK